jgi:hypothetical protein
MKNNWQNFVDSELAYFRPKLEDLGFSLLDHQPHLKGERSAFRAEKLILLGERKVDGLKVIIKVSRDKNGISEVLEERKGRTALSEIKFSYSVFNDPEQVYFHHKNNELIYITKFIEEEQRFLDRSLEEQFKIVHKALTSLEGVHVVVKKHEKEAQKFFKVYNFASYKNELIDNKKEIILNFPNLKTVLDKAENIFLKEEYRVTQFGNFLTHFDFVPHNFRVHGEKIYLLDHSSLRIGNKHEGWARLLNFLILHGAELAKKINRYFEINRSKEEIESLYLMRVFRFVELIKHHNKIYLESNGDLKILSHERVLFWANMLEAHLENREFDQEQVENYKNKRDNLRSNDEKERQKVLY